jgi:hypothetical protein
VVETTLATSPQTMRLTGLRGRAVHAWDTDLTSMDPNAWFQQSPDPTVAKGSATLTLQPGHIYTFTSAGDGHHGDAQPPGDSTMTLPYVEDFNGYTEGDTPAYLSDQEGTWETAKCLDGRDVGSTHAGKCLEQTTTSKPVRWRPETLDPLTVVGDPSWSGDYTVGVDALLDRPGMDAELTGRVTGFDLLGTGLAGYHLRLGQDGTWSLFRETTGNRSGNHVDTPLASGTVDLAPGSWHRIALAFDGDLITPLIDGHAVSIPIKDDSYDHGQIGLQVGGYYRAQFDNLTVTPN